jgi:molybdenum cofactor cytidylyltransferase
MSPNISAIVLAAGTSKRFGAENKLLIDWGGKPMIRHVVETVLAADPGEVVVVTGHEADRIESALAGLPVRFAFNERYQEGMGTSIACGVRAASPHTYGFLIALGDMPNLKQDHYHALIARFRDVGGMSAVISQGGQVLTCPAIFPSGSRSQLAGLAGDKGARAVWQLSPQPPIPVGVSSAQLEDTDSLE